MSELTPSGQEGQVFSTFWGGWFLADFLKQNKIRNGVLRKRGLSSWLQRGVRANLWYRSQNHFDMFRIKLIQLAFGLIEKYLVRKISFEPMRDWVAFQVKVLEQVAQKLTDKNPDDKTQLRQLWNEIAPELFDQTLETAAQIALVKIKDPELARDVADLLLSLAEDEGDDAPAAPAHTETGVS